MSQYRKVVVRNTKVGAILALTLLLDEDPTILTGDNVKVLHDPREQASEDDIEDSTVLCLDVGPYDPSKGNFSHEDSSTGERHEPVSVQAWHIWEAWYNEHEKVLMPDEERVKLRAKYSHYMECVIRISWLDFVESESSIRLWSGHGDTARFFQIVHTLYGIGLIHSDEATYLRMGVDFLREMVGQSTGVWDQMSIKELPDKWRDYAKRSLGSHRGN